MQREKLSECDKRFEERRSGSTDARPMLAAGQFTEFREEFREERRQGVLIRSLMADYGPKKATICRCFFPRNVWIHILQQRPLHCRRAEDQDGKGQDQSVWMLPDPAPRRGMVPDLKLPELDGGTLPNPLVAFQIALAGKAVDIIKLHNAQLASMKG